MNRYLFLIIGLLTFGADFVVAKDVVAKDKEELRVISLSPAITESIAALGKQNLIVGISGFESNIEDYKEVAIVGAVNNLNLEKVVSLKPDLIFVPKSIKLRQLFRSAGIDVVFLDQARSIEMILESIKELGLRLDAREEAAFIIADINRRLNAIKLKASKLKKKKVLISFGRMIGERPIKSLYSVSSGSFINDIAIAANGENVLLDRVNVSYPLISNELLMVLKPDVIIEVLDRDWQSVELSSRSEDMVSIAREDWDATFAANVTSNAPVKFIVGQNILSPSHKFILLVEDMFEKIHDLSDETSKLVKIK